VDASPDFVEIVIVAQDLASAKVNQVADRVEGRLKKMSATASASGSGFTNLGRSIEDAGIKGDQLAINFDNLEHHTGQLSLGFKELEYEMTKESRAATQSHSTHQTLLGGILRLITAGGAWVDHLARSTTATITHSNAVRRITNDFQRFEAVARRAIRPVEEWASRAVMAAQSAIGWSRANLDLAGNFGKIGTALGSINPLMLKFVGLAALISFAVVGVSGAIVALTGAVTALASALSTLSARSVRRDRRCGGGGAWHHQAGRRRHHPVHPGAGKGAGAGRGRLERRLRPGAPGRRCGALAVSHAPRRRPADR
jgi:hypothetical protein